eukprot:3032238-Rhodomonas_salina.1
MQRKTTFEFGVHHGPSKQRPCPSPLLTVADGCSLGHARCRIAAMSGEVGWLWTRQGQREPRK